jgi:hypothetical protein
MVRAENRCDTMFNIEQFWGCIHLYSVKMRKSELTPKQLKSVSCPTCGAAIGQRCELHSGGLRSESHVARKFAALEAFEKKSS